MGSVLPQWHSPWFPWAISKDVVQKSNDSPSMYSTGLAPGQLMDSPQCWDLIFRLPFKLKAPLLFPDSLTLLQEDLGTPQIPQHENLPTAQLLSRKSLGLQ